MFKKFITATITTVAVSCGLLLLSVVFLETMPAQNSHSSTSWVPQSSGGIQPVALPPNVAMVDVPNVFTQTNYFSGPVAFGGSGIMSYAGGISSTVSNQTAPITLSGNGSGNGGNGFLWTNTLGVNVLVLPQSTNAAIVPNMGFLGNVCIISNMPLILQNNEWVGITNAKQTVIKVF